MKKAAALVLAVCVCCGAALTAFAGGETPVLQPGVPVRDPCVLLYEGRYYIYGTGLAWPGYGCRVSDDLVGWSDPVPVFTPPAGFDGCGDWWAPECHLYQGRFYLFATYRSAASGKRGTAVFVSDSPAGPFAPLSDGHITPKERDCIDGTLYIDEQGDPWIVYVSEWTSNADGVGLMSAARLSGDLSRMVSEPVHLFGARDAAWAGANVTDGPWLYRTASGKLLMLWSNGSKTGYAVGIAASQNGRIDGKWTQQRRPLYQKDRRNALDGGHGMLFRTSEGRLLLSIHAPNTATENEPTLARFLPVTDLGFTLVVGDNALLRAIQPVCVRFSSVVERFRRAFSCV